MSRIPITKDGEISLKKELATLKFEERPKISLAIAEARAHGDLKENAEYHAAKELQGLMEAKISKINMKLSTRLLGIWNLILILETFQLKHQ